MGGKRSTLIFASQFKNWSGIELWCNGSTTDFGSVCLGSNPSSSTLSSKPGKCVFHKEGVLNLPGFSAFLDMDMHPLSFSSLPSTAQFCLTFHALTFSIKRLKASFYPIGNSILIPNFHRSKVLSWSGVSFRMLHEQVSKRTSQFS